MGSGDVYAELSHFVTTFFCTAAGGVFFTELVALDGRSVPWYLMSADNGYMAIVLLLL